MRRHERRRGTHECVRHDGQDGLGLSPAAQGSHPNLIRRPILMEGKHMILGLDETEYEQAVKSAT